MIRHRFADTTPLYIDNKRFIVDYGEEGISKIERSPVTL